jgi:acetyltransferase
LTAARFDPERFFRPERIAVSGAATALGQAVLGNLATGGFAGVVGTDGDPAAPADVAIVADDAADVGAALAAHGRRGVRGAVVLAAPPDLAGLARAAGVRVLGPHSFGLMLPGLALNASVLPLPPAAGRVALVGQSASLARTVLDWAVPNSIGFSHVIGIGGNADIGFGLVLDFLARDPGTNAILIEIDRLRDPRLFHSAARAAARLRPVVALAPGARMRDAEGTGRAAIEAGFSRAGILLTDTIGEFLAAAETLTRVKPARGESLAIVSNSVSAGRLAADYSLGAGIRLARLSEETAQVLELSLGHAPPRGPIFIGRAAPGTRLAEVAALLSPAPEVGGILVVHAPTGGAQDDAAMAALIACAKTVKIPLLIVAMGEASGLAHRHRLAQAGLACFETPEAAIAGFRHLLRNRANRAAARELPASTVLQVAPDKAGLRRLLAPPGALLAPAAGLAAAAAYGIAVVDGQHAATPEEAAMVAAAIGYPVVVKIIYPAMPLNRPPGSIALDLPDGKAVRAAARAIVARLKLLGEDLAGAVFLVQQQAPRGTALRIRVADHRVLGPVIGFGAGGGDPESFAGMAFDLPPLNLKLAEALIDRAAVAAALAAHRGAPAADRAAIAAALVRVSQMVVDTPEILALEIDPLFAHERGVVATSVRLRLRPAGEVRPPLVISPYPAELAHGYAARGRRFTLRPIRPEDADAHAAMFSRLTPEDVRYRFFSAMRSLGAEQISRMTDVDYGREMAFVAVDEASGQTVGVARLVRNDTDGATAEFAVVVEPAAKGMGLAGALMRAIIGWGKAQGVQEILGQVLAENAPMLRFIQGLGFTVARIPGESAVVEVRLRP